MVETLARHEMNALDAFRQSNMWHQEHDLPLSPDNNNPWFYLALAVKVIERRMALPLQFWARVAAHMTLCEKEPGLFHRWPNHDKEGGARDDVTSHDELIGLCYLSPDAASRIFFYLVRHDGEYNNTDQPDPIGKWNLFRIHWFPQYVKARAGIPLSLLSQLSWSILLIWDMLKTKKETDDAAGRLLIWVMSEHMKDFSLCRIVIDLWRQRMKSLEITPAAMLLKEPKENPILAQYGPEEF